MSLDFDAQVTWDLEVLVSDTVDWLNSPSHSETSKVGTLSSPRFLELTTGSIGPKLGRAFQQMIYAISCAYTRTSKNDGSFLTSAELHHFGSLAGHEVLGYLDERLKPVALGRCSHDDARALFLWVFGTILAVGYAGSGSSKTVSVEGVNFTDVQSHLCQILAHYLLLLGTQLGLAMEAGTDRFLLEAAPARWYREGRFEWNSSLRDRLRTGLSSSSYHSQHDISSSASAEDMDPHSRYFLEHYESNMLDFHEPIIDYGDGHRHEAPSRPQLHGFETRKQCQPAPRVEWCTAGKTSGFLPVEKTLDSYCEFSTFQEEIKNSSSLFSEAHAGAMSSRETLNSGEIMNSEGYVLVVKPRVGRLPEDVLRDVTRAAQRRQMVSFGITSFNETNQY